MLSQRITAAMRSRLSKLQEAIMVKRLDQNPTRRRSAEVYTGADAVVAALWAAFYLIAIAAAVTAPFFVGPINIAAR